MNAFLAGVEASVSNRENLTPPSRSAMRWLPREFMDHQSVRAAFGTAAFISRRRELINRLFSIPDVGRAKVEQRLGAITLWLLKGGFQRSELLEASAAAMRLAEAARHSFPNQPPGQPDLHVFRSGR